jgi:hypothetical protein
MELHTDTLKVLHPQPSRRVVKRFGERVSEYAKSSPRLEELEELATHKVICLGKVLAVWGLRVRNRHPAGEQKSCHSQRYQERPTCPHHYRSFLNATTTII